MPQQWRKMHIWFAAVILIIILYNLPIPSIGQRFNVLLAPLVDALKAPVRWSDQLGLWFEDSQSLHTKNRKLEQMVRRQAAMQQEALALRAENSQLRALLGLKTIQGYHWQAAEVLSRSLDRVSQHLLLRMPPGVKPDDVVAASEGLVGLVDYVQGRHAIVRTILDASLAVPVTTQKGRLAALVRGQGASLRVEFIPWKSAPPVGAVLITSGAGGLFPPGLPVATIQRIEQMPGEVFAYVEAEPVARWRQLAWLSIASKQAQ
jgi:rod shape-determining protein MreC